MKTRDGFDAFVCFIPNTNRLWASTKKYRSLNKQVRKCTLLMHHGKSELIKISRDDNLARKIKPTTALLQNKGPRAGSWRSQSWGARQLDGLPAGNTPGHTSPTVRTSSHSRKVASPVVTARERRSLPGCRQRTGTHVCAHGTLLPGTRGRPLQPLGHRGR